MPELASKKQCTGCTACQAACVSGCIAMQPDQFGFSYPVIDPQKCASCGLCEKVCPILNTNHKETYEPVAFAAYAKDNAVRASSSSGGIFTEVAKTVLQNDGAVFGCAYDERFEVTHICAETESELVRLRGAKYAQSNLQNTFLEVKRRLENGQQVLFCGTPCQVGGLSAYLRKDYSNLLLVDFVCHSIPSPMVWREFLRELSKENDISAINLRSKDTGWSRYRYSHLVEYNDGTQRVIKNADSLYMRLFVGGYISRESCSDCHFKGYHRISDLTLGDFWGIWDIAPEMDDNKGTSVVLVQSVKGAALLKSIEENVYLKPVSLEEASRANQAILRSALTHPQRNQTLERIKMHGISDCTKLFTEPKPSMSGRVKRLIKKILK